MKPLVLLVLPLLYLMFERRNADRVPGPTAAEELGSEFAQQPVGTGPFMFEKWEGNDLFLRLHNAIVDGSRRPPLSRQPPPEFSWAMERRFRDTSTIGLGVLPRRGKTKDHLPALQIWRSMVEVRNYVSLDPQRSPAHVMQLRARLRRENDFDYFL